MLICLELKNDPLGVNLGNNLCAVVIKAKPLHLPLLEFLSAIHKLYIWHRRYECSALMRNLMEFVCASNCTID